MSNFSNTSDGGYDIILAIGQSNMEGFGVVDNGSPNGIYYDSQRWPTHPRVFQWGRNAPLTTSTSPNTGAGTGGKGSYDGQIVVADDPLHHPRIWNNPSGASGLLNTTTAQGPARAFANAYADSLPNRRRVLIVPVSWSATSQARWKANDTNGSYLLANGNNVFTDAMIRLQKALASSSTNRMGAIIVSQGESDVGVLSQSAFATSAGDFIDRIRAVCGVAAPVVWAPFTLVWTGTWSTAYDGSGNLTGTASALSILNGIDGLVSTKAYFGVIPRTKRSDLAGNTSATWQGDVHFDGPSQWIVGRRLFEDALPAARANSLSATVPTAPTIGVASSVTSSQFSIAWTGAQANNVVLVRPTGTTEWTVAGSSATSPFTVSGLGNVALTAGVQYDTCIVGVNAAGIPSAKSGTVQVTLSSASATSVAITPNSGISIATGGTQTFTATPTGGNWSLSQQLSVALTNGGTIGTVTNGTLGGSAPNYTITPTSVNTTAITWVYTAPGSATTVTMATTSTGGTSITISAGASISIGVVGVATSIAVTPSSGSISPSASQAITLTPNGVWQAGNTATATLTGTPGGSVTAASGCSVTGSGPWTITPTTNGVSTPMVINYVASTTTGTESVAITSALTVTGSPVSVTVSGLPAFPTLASGTVVNHWDPNQNVVGTTALTVTSVLGGTDTLTSSSSGVSVATNVQNSLSMFSVASTSSAGLIATSSAAWLAAVQNLSNSGAHTIVFVLKTKGTLPNSTCTYNFEGTTAAQYDEYTLFFNTTAGLVSRANTNGAVVIGNLIPNPVINTLYKCILRFNAGGTVDGWSNGVQTITGAAYTPGTGHAWTNFVLGSSTAALGTLGTPNAYFGDFVPIQGAVSGTTSTGDVANIIAWETTKWGT